VDTRRESARQIERAVVFNTQMEVGEVKDTHGSRLRCSAGRRQQLQRRL
jgi:hypothetical protein